LEGTCADTLGLVVAPTTGRFQPAAASGRADEVRAPVDARLKNMLVRPRQLVRQGQALAWLEVSSA
jgi:biotin carboxyl carrier protein